METPEDREDSIFFAHLEGNTREYKAFVVVEKVRKEEMAERKELADQTQRRQFDNYLKRLDRYGLLSLFFSRSSSCA